MNRKKYNGKVAILQPKDGGFLMLYQPVLLEVGWCFGGSYPTGGGTLILSEDIVLSGKTQWGKIILVNKKDFERKAKRAHKIRMERTRQREKMMKKVADILEKEKTIVGVEKVRMIIKGARQKELQELRKLRKENEGI